MIGRFKAWLEKPLDTRFMQFFIIVALALACAIGIAGQSSIKDIDAPYMITEGRRILAEGFTGTNPYLFFENYRLPIQQWLYCIIIASAESAFPDHIGVIMLAVFQVILLIFALHKFIRPYIGDSFWSYLTAILLLIIYNGYVMTVRPENITLIFLTIDMIALDRYKRTDDAKYLYILPVMMLLEINMHASMWPIHFCVLLANAFPNILKNTIRNTQMKLKGNKHLIIAVSLMCAALFVNPYGLDNIAYVFKSMGTFSYIGITEQSPVKMINAKGLTIMALIIISAVLAAKKKLSSTALYAVAGFSLLAMAAHHATMFLPLAGTYLSADLLSILKEKTGNIKAASTMQNSMWICVIIAIMIEISILIAGTAIGLIDYDYDYVDIKPIIAYINSNDPEHEYNTLNHNDIGSLLEYEGFRNIYIDTRPESLNKKINGKEDSMELQKLISMGIPAKKMEVYDIGSLLKEYDIKYIIIPCDKNMWSALNEYLENHHDEYALPDLTAYGQPLNISMAEIYRRSRDEKDILKSMPDYILYERID